MQSTLEIQLFGWSAFMIIGSEERINQLIKFDSLLQRFGEYLYHGVTTGDYTLIANCERIWSTLTQLKVSVCVQRTQHCGCLTQNIFLYMRHASTHKHSYFLYFRRRDRQKKACFSLVTNV